MRSAVLAAVLGFHPRLAWTRAPFQRMLKGLGAAALKVLDERRARADGAKPLPNA